MFLDSHKTNLATLTHSTVIHLQFLLIFGLAVRPLDLYYSRFCCTNSSKSFPHSRKQQLGYKFFKQRAKSNKFVEKRADRPKVPICRRESRKLILLLPCFLIRKNLRQLLFFVSVFRVSNFYFSIFSYFCQPYFNNAA